MDFVSILGFKFFSQSIKLRSCKFIKIKIPDFFSFPCIFKIDSLMIFMIIYQYQPKRKSFILSNPAKFINVFLFCLLDLVYKIIDWFQFWLFFILKFHQPFFHYFTFSFNIAEVAMLVHRINFIRIDCVRFIIKKLYFFLLWCWKLRCYYFFNLLLEWIVFGIFF